MIVVTVSPIFYFLFFWEKVSPTLVEWQIEYKLIVVLHSSKLLDLQNKEWLRCVVWTRHMRGLLTGLTSFLFIGNNIILRASKKNYIKWIVKL